MLKCTRHMSALVLSFCLISSACTPKDTQLLVDAMLASCPEPDVFLSGWWSGASLDPEVDPIGGFVMTYWVDEDGNACHGNPGTSGQPGPFALKAFHPDAWSAARDGLPVSTAQLEEYQEIRFSVTPYAGSGLHFVQFDNVLWRKRADQTAFRSNNSFSVPAVISMDQSSFCINAVYTTEPECAMTDLLPLPIMAPAGQHPTMCKIRSQPTNISPTIEVRLDSCLLRLPHGLEITEP